MSDIANPTVSAAAGSPGGVDLVALWKEIQKVNGIAGWITSELNRRGLSVERRDSRQLSDSQRSEYKKSLRAEAEERRRLRKLAWAAYRANNIVHVGEGVFWSDSAEPDKYDLPNAEERAAENEFPPMDRPGQLAEALGLTIPQLRWMAYHRDAATRLHYRRFTIPKRGGGERAIWAPLPKLKAVQRWILANVAERIPVHGAAHGFLTGRSTLSNAAAHGDSKIVVRMDIRDFFPTVTLRRVKGHFRRAGCRERVATLLALLCTEAPREVVEKDGKTYFIAMGPRCLPQGAPTSPALTNALCLRLDRRVAGLARKLGWRYTRYADDLTFSLPTGHKGQPGLGKLLGSVTRIVAAEGFEIRPDKTRVFRSGGRQSVTGLVVNGAHGPRVPRKLRRTLRAVAHNLAHGKPLRTGETLAHWQGQAAYVQMAQPELGRKLMAALESASAKSPSANSASANSASANSASANSAVPVATG